MCKQFSVRVEKRGKYAWQDDDLERMEFLKQLEQWIENGEAKTKLEEIIQSERKRLGYL
jgi:biopolymer transport protein ExbD